MQALLLNGSPRGAASNTLRLSRAFLQGTGWPFETFSLTENRIEPCRGCMACWRSGAPCTIADDFSAFVGQFRRADVLIASFPLYYFGLPAQLKALLDRTISLMEPYHGQTPEGGHCSFQTLRDPALRRKKLVVISSCGYTEAAPCMKRCWPSLTGCAAAGIIRPCFSRRASCSRWKSWTGRGPPSAGLRGGRPGVCRNGNALGADACRGAAADGRSPCL